MLAKHTAGAPRHEVLTLTGGAIGQGLPVAVGAAVACPDRPVFALQADGAAMYTIQALWTMAREQLDVTVVIFNNRSYAILNIELERTGAEGAGPKAQAQLDLTEPNLDFVQLGKGMGVPSVCVDTGEQLTAALERAVTEPGPHPDRGRGAQCRQWLEGQGLAVCTGHAGGFAAVSGRNHQAPPGTLSKPSTTKEEAVTHTQVHEVTAVRPRASTPSLAGTGRSYGPGDQWNRDWR
jgi:Thiamine pyrophosphate enzyme, C-terminal TPP binding domain